MKEVRLIHMGGLKYKIKIGPGPVSVGPVPEKAVSGKRKCDCDPDGPDQSNKKPRNGLSSKPKNCLSSKPRNALFSKPRNALSQKTRNGLLSKPQIGLSSKPRNGLSSKPHCRCSSNQKSAAAASSSNSLLVGAAAKSLTCKGSDSSSYKSPGVRVSSSIPPVPDLKQLLAAAHAAKAAAHADKCDAADPRCIEEKARAEFERQGKKSDELCAQHAYYEQLMELCRCRTSYDKFSGAAVLIDVHTYEVVNPLRSLGLQFKDDFVFGYTATCDAADPRCIEEKARAEFERQGKKNDELCAQHAYYELLMELCRCRTSYDKFSGAAVLIDVDTYEVVNPLRSLGLQFKDDCFFGYADLSSCDVEEGEIVDVEEGEILDLVFD